MLLSPPPPPLTCTVSLADHVCNLREFKILVASEDAPERWIPVLHSGLSNDAQPETFALTYPAWIDPVLPGKLNFRKRSN